MSAAGTHLHAVDLEDLAPLAATVGYGRLGARGDLGYDGGHVAVGGQFFGHALSTHPPARVIYDLGGAYERFHCWVALTDDVAAGRSYADFCVRADGREVALVPGVWAGAGAFELTARVTGAQLLELSVRTTRWEHCHAVWLEPRLDRDAAPAAAGVLTDCLGRAELAVPDVKPRADRCVATVASPGFEGLLDDLLGSLRANGGCGDALVAVLALGLDGRVAEVVAKHGAVLIRGTPRARLNQASKAVLYSIAQLVDARQLPLHRRRRARPRRARADLRRARRLPRGDDPGGARGQPPRLQQPRRGALRGVRRGARGHRADPRRARRRVAVPAHRQRRGLRRVAPGAAGARRHHPRDARRGRVPARSGRASPGATS